MVAYVFFALLIMGSTLLLGWVFAWPFIVAEQLRNERITRKMRQLGDFYREGTERMEALHTKWQREDDAT